jgi:hypothetical protein
MESKLDGVTSQKTLILMLTAVITTNVTQMVVYTGCAQVT